MGTAHHMLLGTRRLLARRSMFVRWLGLVLVVGVATAASPSRQAFLPVCIGADNILNERVGASCAGSGRSYNLPLGPAPAAADSPDAEELLRQIADLQRQVRALTTRVDQYRRDLADKGQQGPGTTVVAPFEVVNEQGKPVMRVEVNSSGGGNTLRMWNATAEVAWLSAIDQGAFLKTRTAGGGFPEMVVGTATGFAGLTVRDADQQGRATLGLANGKPSLSLTNDNHVGIVSIHQGTTGGGHLELGDAAGNGQVRAGITAGGCGRVETYPQRPARATALGVPGDKILGNC